MQRLRHTFRPSKFFDIPDLLLVAGLAGGPGPGQKGPAALKPPGRQDRSAPDTGVRLDKLSGLKFDELVKSQFPLPGWEGIKGRGTYLAKDADYFTPTLALPQQGGGNSGLLGSVAPGRRPPGQGKAAGPPAGMSTAAAPRTESAPWTPNQ